MRQFEMLDIYKYVEAHKYLRDAWVEKHRRNRSFSMTAWAKQLGLENSSPLSLALKGKRPLPKKYIPQIVSTLNLSYREGLYLEALVELSRAKNAHQKIFYLNRLREVAPADRINSTMVEEYKLISEPLHTALLELTDISGFRLDPYWIRDSLYMKVSLHEIDEALDRLIRLGLLKRDEKSGKIRKTHQYLSTQPDLEDLGARKYHDAVSKLAAELVHVQDVHEREFGSYAFNMKKAQLRKAKEKLRGFLDEFFKEFEAAPGEGDSTFQMNLQLFRLTK